ncbi:MAG: hypothetical protein K6G85_00150 [Eubacterium sp.]|nr:hypothetical protein [Eubacterium sp.]
MRKLNLRLFDGAAVPAPAAAQGTGTQSGAEPQANGSEAEKKVVYGLGPEGKTTEGAPEEKGKGGDNSETVRLENYKKFKSENKDLIQKDIDAAINKRFKQTKGLEERLEAINPLLSMLGNRYNLDSNNINGIVDAFINDDAQYQGIAEAEGLTLEQAKKMESLERYRRAQEEAANRQNAESTYQEWVEQAEALKETYPDFDLDEASMDAQFVRVLQNGFTVQQAYELTHPDAMTERLKNEVSSAMAANINARQNRPSELGISASKVEERKTDVKKFTREDRKKAIEQSMRYGNGSVRFS